MFAERRLTVLGELAGEYVLEQELPDGRLIIRRTTPRPGGPGCDTDAAAVQEELVQREHERAEAEVERFHPEPDVGAHDRPGPAESQSGPGSERAGDGRDR
jgi:hypothetical protein